MQSLTDVISQGNIETVSQNGGGDKCWGDKKKVMNYTWTLDRLQICPCVCAKIMKVHYLHSALSFKPHGETD